MATRRAPNLVDQFSRATVPVAPSPVVAPAPLPPVPVAPAPLPPMPQAPAAAADAPGATLAAGGGAASTTTCSKSGGLACWLKANWGKALGVTLVIVVTTIFIVRAVLVARNKKRAKEEEKRAAASASAAEWESFLDDTSGDDVNPALPLTPPSLVNLRPLPAMPPHAHAQQQPPHFPHVPGHAGHPSHMHHSQPPMPPPPPPVPGVTPLPPPHIPLAPPPPNRMQAPPPTSPQHQHAPQPQDGGRGVQQRMPPAEGSQGNGGPGFTSMLPESTRPIRVAPTPQLAHEGGGGGGGGGIAPVASAPNATFTISDTTQLPTVSVPEQDAPSRETQLQEPGMAPPDRGDMPPPDKSR